MDPPSRTSPTSWESGFIQDSARVRQLPKKQRRKLQKHNVQRGVEATNNSNWIPMLHVSCTATPPRSSARRLTILHIYQIFVWLMAMFTPRFSRPAYSRSYFQMSKPN
ncbi:hypothetical protein D6C91_06378 [Aureobasidium pullulans]|uniref:Uncharacterized protein n=1 Tax=Aureobasidium pullulans TaxID=5580 RepID=A0A4S8TGZ1_AURPU|nr:hypothetical protein D6D29_04162 [Aureobasidium pullulans]THZ00083.1 hypothetical protein D6C93_03779 [Aureobasidium pullulans]THZ16385.1 hypothetical protein D6C91_06378 [Aureobasidium pullulans]TIA47975.1 hypothetical protein D6C83_05100 [Aureobasidium pullulans]